MWTGILASPGREPLGRRVVSGGMGMGMGVGAGAGAGAGVGEAPGRLLPCGAMAAGAPVALSIDDAPSVSGDGERFDPGRMDAIRALLRDRGLRHCTAFVIGESARGHEAVLERWLADGFALGNHGQQHVPASLQSPAEFAASLRACDALLERVGAFEGGAARALRMPFGDRGRDPEHRAALRRVCDDLGYVMADVSINLYDWCYESPLTRAVAAGDESATARILGRFLRAARRELEAACRRRPTAAWVDLAACHFGEVSTRALGRLLDGFGGRVDWRPLDDALGQPVYQTLMADLDVNGILGDRLARGTWRRPVRRAARWLRRRDWLQESRLGPVAPRYSA